MGAIEKGVRLKDLDAVKARFSPETSARDRAVFENAITLSGIYHQFIGSPIPKDKTELENVIKSISETQPFISRAEAAIKDQSKQNTPYSYGTLRRDNFELTIVSEYEGIQVESRIEWQKDLQYPLMRITRIEEK